MAIGTDNAIKSQTAEMAQSTSFPIITFDSKLRWYDNIETLASEINFVACIVKNNTIHCHTTKFIYFI